MFGRKHNSKLVDNAVHFPLDTKVGLTTAQVEERTADGLINKTKKHVTKSYFRIIYENVCNFFNLLLFAITAFMIIAKVSITSYAFLVILLANIAIGLYQDIRARKLIDKLKVVSTPKVNVLRDGEIKSIPANQLVFSDLIEIRQGSQIVCDGSIVDGFIEVNESLLTGEPINISKNVGDSIYSGSFATSGYAFYRVEQLGKDNYAEKLQAKAKKFKKVKSEILRNIKRIFKVIGFFVIVLAGVQFLVNKDNLIWPGFANMAESSFQKSAEHISGSLIAMIPTGMYLLTSVTLAVGAIRLAKRNMLTQDMYCIEMLARIDTLCLDKTGTLTDGQLSVKTVVSTSDVSERDIAKIVYTLIEATKDNNATARAIKNAFGTLNKFDSYSAIPFSSDRKYSAVMLEDGRSIVMGARELIPHTNPEIDDQCREYEKCGLRVLVLGLHSHVITVDDPLGMSEIIGFIVLEDHIRDDAPENIEWFKNNGVSIRIITGDNPESAGEIARRAGIEGWEKQISLEGMPVEEIKQIAKDYIVFGRVTPEQKEAIIEALKEDGHKVAMTGDGVNDILALRVADCSIAMASGSDAAKNVSHLVSLDSNFSTLPDVVKEGRRVINNLQRAVSIFLIKTVFSILITTAFVVVGLFVKDMEPYYPFVTNNLYVWEILFIGIGSLFLSLQPNDELIKSKFIVNIVIRVFPAAIIQTLLVIFFFSLYYFPNVSGGMGLATTLSVLSISAFSFVILVRVCLPFDIYRIFLVIGLGFIGVVAVLADYLALGDNSFLGIKYSYVDKKHLLILLAAVAVAALLYVVMEILISKVYNKNLKKKEVEQNENF